MNVALIDYGSGNLHSAAKAFERAAHEAGLDAAITVTADPQAVRRADRVVLPGVGAFADCRRGLDSLPGMVEAMTEAVHERGRPFFGICVGMQLMATRGLEYETTPGPRLDSGRRGPDRAARSGVENPAHGLEHARRRRGAPAAGRHPDGSDGLHAYFVHSYALQPANDADVLARTDYGGPITAVVARDNMAGAQFHPEKSQRLGLKLLANFLRWRP